MTGWLRLCLEMVSRMSAAVFRQRTLCGTQWELTAEKSSVRSSFRASSSTAGTWVQSRNKTCARQIRDI